MILKLGKPGGPHEYFATQEQENYRYRRQVAAEQCLAQCWKCKTWFPAEQAVMAPIGLHWKAEFCGDDCVADYAAWTVKKNSR